MSSPRSGSPHQPSQPDWMGLVRQFHVKFQIAHDQAPAVRDGETRKTLISGESKEVCDAIDSGDLVAVAHELCDLLYCCYGTAVSMGLDLGPIYEEVHRANMLKSGRLPSGKIAKPPGWQPPDVAKLVALQIAAYAEAHPCHP